MNRADRTTKTQDQLSDVCLEEEGSELLVFNDDVHTFDFVIECLQTVCLLTKEQAVNCTNIIHYKGLCVVRHGSYDAMNAMCRQLLQKGLKAEVR